MRIRTIKPEFFEDEGLAKLPALDRLLFIGLWCMADKNGTLPYNPALISSKLFPYGEPPGNNGETTGKHLDATQIISRLISGNHLVPYQVDGRDYLMIRTFRRHQRITGKEALGDGRNPLPDQGFIKKETTGKHPGSTGETPGKHPGAQEQGTGNREQGGGSAHAHPSAHAPARGEVATPPPPLETHGQDPEPEPKPAPFPEDDPIPVQEDPPRPAATPAPETSDPAARKAANRERLRTALGREGLAFHGDAFQEWQHALQGIAGCKTIEDCLAAVAWLGTAARKTGRAVRYLKDCKDLLEAWGRQRRASA